MCGIAGLLARTIDERAALAAMVGKLAHRGPDDGGVWHDAATGMGLGHRRLSIIDTSGAGHQPMISASGRLALSFNGEIYNFQQLRSELDRTGASPVWRGHSDTEVLLAGFEAWGVEATLKRCNGMFALAAWDRSEGILTLARDRMGEKPLYFGWIAGRFAFASEMKALTCVPGWRPRMHVGAIERYLHSGYIQGPQSAISGIYRLPPGCLLRLTLDQLRQGSDWTWLSSHTKSYWSLQDVALDGLSSPLTDAEAAVGALEARLAESVAMRMVADVPLGAFLSGGIDSSLVTAVMQSRSPRPISTFSIGFDVPEFDESPHAREVARHLGTDHNEVRLGAKEALEVVPSLAATFDEPFADHSQIPTLLVSALARHHVKVVLSGDGGDELFAGYDRYFAALRFWGAARHLPATLRRVIARLIDLPAAIQHISSQRLGQLAHRMLRLADRLSASDADALRLSFIGGAGMRHLLHTHAATDQKYCRAPIGVTDTLRRLMYGDQLDYLPDDILHKVDRASMAHGLEARVPLLDYRLIELSWRLPVSMLASETCGKVLLRRLLEKYVPRALFDRPKQGFVPPMDAWLRGPLRAWGESLLSPGSLRELPMIDQRAVCRLWLAHQRGHRNAGYALWKVLNLADWRRLFGATC